MILLILAALISQNGRAQDEGLTREQIQATVSKNTSQAMSCYKEALKRDPKNAGTITMLIVISKNGRVETAKVDLSEIEDQPMQECMVRKIKTWRFARPLGNAKVSVRYPFAFSNLKNK